MDFEEILKDVGSFGKYQMILMVAFLIPTYTVIPWFSMNTIFISNEPKHWCYVPQVSESNLSMEEKMALVGPPHDPACSMYDVNFTDILLSRNLSVDPNWTTKKCNYGWEYDTTEYDATSVTKWNMVCDDAVYSSLFQSILFTGDIIGTPFFGYMSDKWGRRPTFFFLALIIALSEIGSTLSPNFILFLTLKALNGSALSAIYGAGYIIVIELVDPLMRTRINGVTSFSWTAGLCLLPLLAHLTRDWLRLSIATSTAAAALFFYWKILPESPRWLLSQERYEEAAMYMARISKTNSKTAHDGKQLIIKMEQLGEYLKKQKECETKSSPLDFFKYPLLRKRFLMVSFCWLGVAFPYFGLQFNVKNLGGNEFVNFFLLSVMEIPSHIVTWFCMEKVGRRWSAVSSFCLSTIACLLPILIPKDAISEKIPVSVLASLLAKISSSASYMILYQQAPEIFPTNLRAVGMAMACAISTLALLIVPYIVFFAKFSESIPFLVFAAISACSALVASRLPETLHKNLPQTPEDAEHFQRNMTLCSCGINEDEEQERNHSTPHVGCD